MDREIDIFISYSHEDSDFAKEMLSELEGIGLNCYMAEIHIAPGELWEADIRKAIVKAKRILLLITPNSKNSLWIAAEAGAAWALEKELIAGLRYVKPEELIEVIRKHQVHKLEAKSHVESLLKWLVPEPKFKCEEITGQWIDPVDGDTVYFRQLGDTVIGYYDFGTGTKKVGLYQGTLQESQLDYSWKWIDNDLKGQGIMRLSKDKNTLSGEWWLKDDPKDHTKVQYRRVSDEMPDWLSESDFSSFFANNEQHSEKNANKAN